MPMASPSYPALPFQFINREFLIITYRSDPAAIREAVPEPLAPDGNDTVLYELIKMLDSYGFGDYTKSGVVIPCTYKGEPVNFTAQMYLDCEPPISGGREIWGFPKKHAHPKLEVVHDILTGTLRYANQKIALGTMVYKFENLIGPGVAPETVAKKLEKTHVNLKIIPGVSGGYDVLQLVAYNLQGIHFKGAWAGPARLSLTPHVNAPIADLPVREVLGGLHMVADLVLPKGRVVFDYLK